MASSSQPPPLPLNPSPPSTTATTTSTAPTTANPTSPSATASTAPSALSSPLLPAPAPAPGPAPSTTASSTPSSALPPATSQRQIAEARAAVTASIGNMLDASLRDRASVLHANAAAIARQERDVARATDALRRETDRLARAAQDAARRVKELGNVQNWAEVLESDFLALEETVRLVREGSWSGSGSEGSWSGSESEAGEEDGDGDVRMEDGVGGGEGGGEGQVSRGTLDKGKGKDTADDGMDVDGEPGASTSGVLQTKTSAGGDAHLPPVQNTTREAPSIKIPGLEPSQTTISLEDELRLAMDQPIGSQA